MKDYGHLFAHDALSGEAAQVAGLAKDVTEVIALLGLPKTQAKGLAVAYHAACSLQHGQKIKSLPKELLTQAGFKVSEPVDSHLCCGSAGTYNILQPEISADLRQRKVASLMARKPDVIAAGNLGCMIQIGQEADVPVVQLSLNRRLDAQGHFDLARRLAPLRDEGVVLAGSGDFVHNLRTWKRAGGEAYPWATAFNEAVKSAFVAGDHDALINWVGLAEEAQMSVPTDEHYLPLLYVAAQQKPGEPVAFFNDAIDGGSISMTGVRIG